MKKHKQSLGEMISSVCFVLLAVYFFLIAFAFLDEGEPLKAALLWLAAGLCGAGGFRFVIAYHFIRLRGRL